MPVPQHCCMGCNSHPAPVELSGGNSCSCTFSSSCFAMHSMRKNRTQKQEFKKYSKLVHHITLHLKAKHQDSAKYEKKPQTNLQWESTFSLEKGKSKYCSISLRTQIQPVTFQLEKPFSHYLAKWPHMSDLIQKEKNLVAAYNATRKRRCQLVTYKLGEKHN